jgi:hypothetical protein
MNWAMLAQKLSRDGSHKPVLSGEANISCKSKRKLHSSQHVKCITILNIE